MAQQEETALLRQQMVENRSNVDRLELEKQQLQRELTQVQEQLGSVHQRRQVAAETMAQLQRVNRDSTDDAFRRDYDLTLEELQAVQAQIESLSTNITSLLEDIALADVLMDNINVIVARQRVRIEQLARGNQPSALDTALSKALEKNQQQLALTRAANAAALEEIARLRALLTDIMRSRERDEATASLQLPQTPLPDQPMDDDTLRAERRHAQNEHARLLDLFNQTDPEQRPPKPIVVAGEMDGRLPYRSAQSMVYLGHGQYHLETPLRAGAVTFIIDRKHWQKNVHASNDNAIFVILYDTADESAPRLVVFRKSLLDATTDGGEQAQNQIVRVD